MSHRFDKKTLEELLKIFKQFDLDKDGTISPAELSEALMIFGCKPKKEELDNIINELDKDKSGELNFEEFIKVFTLQNEKTKTNQELIEAFKLIDSENDGYVTSTQLKLLLTKVGEKLSQEEVEEILNEIDPNGEGYIKYMDLLIN